jgi:membrane-bound lytic murein transglycosylase F
MTLSEARPQAVYPRQYDREIGEAAALYLPQWHWLWLKAQLVAESSLDANAVSKAGAQGVAQFMPATWDDVRAALRFPAAASPFEPRYAIRGAAWYLRLLRQQWRSPRPEDDRRRLVHASYHAGLGNLVKAQRLAGGAVTYAAVIDCLDAVTGAPDASETRDYVVRIARIQQQLVGV